jgi:hypothetical protein
MYVDPLRDDAAALWERAEQRRQEELEQENAHYEQMMQFEYERWMFNRYLTEYVTGVL